ncbi:hypothetical protein [Pyrobaculum aerophilum]|nr:hypothetical protein [Pyrobaculum aerophilum]
MAGPHKIEVKRQRPRRGYPKDVIVLSRSDAPRFLMQLQGVS